MSLLYLAAVATSEVEDSTLIDGFNHFAEAILLETAISFKIIIEGVALIILALAIIKAIKRTAVS